MDKKTFLWLNLFGVFLMHFSEAKDFSKEAPTLAEVNIFGGQAKATSSHASPWTPKQAFLLGSAYAWVSGQVKGEPGPAMFPATVWYEFPEDKTFIPGRVSFRPRQDCCTDLAPTMFQFVGSNGPYCNRYSSWAVLCEDLSGTGYATKATTKYCTVSPEIRQTYRCLGITVLNTIQPTGIASLKDVRMWRRVFP